jgi:hypothetical protein
VDPLQTVVAAAAGLACVALLTFTMLRQGPSTGRPPSRALRELERTPRP